MNAMLPPQQILDGFEGEALSGGSVMFLRHAGGQGRHSPGRAVRVRDRGPRAQAHHPPRLYVAVLPVVGEYVRAVPPFLPFGASAAPRSLREEAYEIIKQRIITGSSGPVRR